MTSPSECNFYLHIIVLQHFFDPDFQFTIIDQDRIADLNIFVQIGIRDIYPFLIAQYFGIGKREDITFLNFDLTSFDITDS